MKRLRAKSGSAKRARRLATRMAERQRLIDAALLLLEQVYVHLPLKRAMHAINPVQELKLLAPQARNLTERQFHQALLTIFLGLRDLHTNYILPAPMNRHTAYLPFRVEEFFTRGNHRYVVTETFPGVAMNPKFVPGVILTHWNGTPIDRAVDLNAEREAGSNSAARHARGLASLTLRWLGMSLPPDEDWVDVTFHPPGKPVQAMNERFEWKIYESSAKDLGVAQAKGAKAMVLGLDIRAEIERQVRRQIFTPTPRSSGGTLGAASLVPSTSPGVFPRCLNVTTRAGVFGYLRIATFDVEDDEAFVHEFSRLAGQLSENGLILDVRGNGGGLVLAGERLLQCLTPQRIQPENFHFINSKITLLLCQHPDLRTWLDSIAQATQIGTEFSAGLPLLPEAEYNNIGQVYQGPVVLITDALCYSTTDIFAAGFQDHGIGSIIGVSENTGAGGANVWDYDLLREFIPNTKSPFKPLPRGAQFRVAIRRTTRVRARAGQPLEDLGVQPDYLHRMTLRDVLEGNTDLIEFAAKILSARPTQSLKAKLERPGKATARISLHTRNLDRVDIYLNDRPLKSLTLPLRPAKRSVTFTARLGGHPKGPDVAELRGFRKGHLVVATRARS